MAEVAQRVEEAVGGAVADLGMLVEDVTVTPAGKKRVVRIAVDRDLGDLDPLPAQDETTSQDAVEPLDLDAVADATRAISAVLDDSDVLGSAPYTLEVTSPGVSRPLTLPRHFRRNVGRLVRLVLSGGGTATGRIVAAGTDAVRLRLEDAAGDAPTHEEYPLADVTRGDVQVEFGRPQQTGPDEQED